MGNLLLKAKSFLGIYHSNRQRSLHVLSLFKPRDKREASSWKEVEMLISYCIGQFEDGQLLFGTLQSHWSRQFHGDFGRIFKQYDYPSHLEWSVIIQFNKQSENWY